MKMVRFGYSALDLDQVVSIKAGELPDRPGPPGKFVVQFRGSLEQEFEGRDAMALDLFVHSLPDGVAVAGTLGAQNRPEVLPGQGHAAQGEQGP